MPDFVYLLENRLSADQRNALGQLRSAAHEAGIILFLTGDAVRDLTSGHAVRELEVAVHGNALKLKKSLEKLGGKVWGEDESSRSLYLCFPGTVRVNVVSTHAVQYPKPGKPVYQWASIQEDLRRRDFTVNSMAISLNEGSLGLLMDPLNGAADIEARILRLVSSYGFIEDPALMIRAVRYRTRLGWEMDARTQARYENAKTEGAIEFLSDHGRRQELEQIGHEEDGLKVLRALEAEGWMKVLFPAWTSAKADEGKLTALHDLAVELLLQGIHPDMSAAQMQLLTAKMQPKDLSALKKALLRPGFVAEWNELDRQAAGFAKVLLAKQNAKPSASYKLFMSYDPEAVLWLGFTSKDKAVQERFHQFLKVWPEARQKIPHALMQEMRITPELPKYAEIAQNVFLQLIDGHLTTPEEMRAYLEPFSPPAPPPQVTIKRTRARRAEARVKEPVFEEEEESEEGPAAEGVEDLGPLGAEDDDDLELGLPKGALAADLEDEEEAEEEEESDSDEEEAPAAGKKRAASAAAEKKEQKAAGKMAKPLAAKTEHAHAAPQAGAKSAAASQGKAVQAKAVAAKPAAAPTKAKPAAAPKPESAPAHKAQKAAAPSKPAAKAPAAKPKPAAKAQPKKLAKPAPHKAPRPAAKPAKKTAAKPSKAGAKVSKKR